MDGAMCAMGFALLLSLGLIIWSLSLTVALISAATWLTSAIVLATLTSLAGKRLRELRGEGND